MRAEYLTPEALAEELGVPLSTVYGWNYARTGPTFIKLGNRCRYRRGDVDAWLRSREVQGRRTA